MTTLQKEQIISALTKKVYAKLSAYDIAILKCIWRAPDGGTEKELIYTLKSQMTNNEVQGLVILGEEAFKLLKQIP